MSTRLPSTRVYPSGSSIPEGAAPATEPVLSPGRLPSPASAVYPVGYGKPPAAHRFQKGKSGNPKGRPKKKKPVVPAQGMSQRAQGLIMEEAYRSVTLREGDQVIRLPAYQAILRKMNLDALKGNRYAQKAMTEMVQAIENEHYILQRDYVRTAIDYKYDWEAEFRRCDRLGIPRPEPVPHPDDIEIDFRTGTVRLVGPLDEYEKKKWDMFTERRKEALKAIEEYQSDLQKDPDNKFILDDIAHEERILQIIDNAMPKRRR